MREEKLLDYLKATCQGRVKSTRSSTLERILGCSGNELRKQVNRLRRKSVPIGSNRDGYFYAVTAGEVYSTIRQLQKMADGLNAAFMGWRNRWRVLMPGRQVLRREANGSEQYVSGLAGRRRCAKSSCPCSLYYERYIEVFGGGGWILFAKPPGNDFEVFNDLNSLLTNLYRCVREKPRLVAALRFVINSREDFELVRSAWLVTSPASDVQKAAWFYQLIRYSMPPA